MKESKLIEMKNQIETLAGALNNLLRDHQNLRALAFGTHETIKNMPGYADALIKLQENLEKQKAENGQEQGDTK